MTIITVDLLRHGEPVGGRIYRGGLDHALTEKGWIQMQTAVEAHNAPWQYVVTSPLKRCHSFSKGFANERGITWQQEAAFVEIGFGAWEGRSAAEIQAENPDEFKAFYADPINNTPPQAEPLLAFEQRVLRTWQNVIVAAKTTQKHHILLVAHAGVIRVILSHVLQIPLAAMYRVSIPNAALSRVTIPLDDAQ